MVKQRRRQYLVSQGFHLLRRSKNETFVDITLVQQELTKSAISWMEKVETSPMTQCYRVAQTWKFVRVGDLLMEHKKYKAALVEYQKKKIQMSP